MDILRLKTFCQVAKLGSLTEAAKQLQYSVPNVSRQITALEESMGVVFFHRKGHKVSLTSQGELLYIKAIQILGSIESAKSLLQETVQNYTGVLHVSTTNTLAALWITPHLKGFLKQYPNMRISIYGDDRHLDLCLRECDVAIAPEMPAHANLIQTYLFTSRIGLYASKAYLEEYGTPSSIEDLDHHRLISRSAWGHLPYTSINWPLFKGRENRSPREPYVATNSIHSSIELALDGIGIACLSDIAKDSRQDQLVQVLPEETSAIKICYMYPRSMEHCKRVTCFLEYLLAHSAAEK